MTREATQEQRWDRERDLRKHEPRPADEAIEIAVLVKQVDVTAAAQLIEQYGRTKFSEGRLDAVTETGNRIFAVIEAPLSRKEPA